MSLYQITLRNVTAGVEVSPDGVVINAAPVFEKFVGTRFVKLCAWITGKGGKIVRAG